MRLTRLTDWLEHQKDIDRLGQPLNQLARRAIPSGMLKDILSGTWLGHPAHPIAVMVPIGSWTSASVLDLAGGDGSAPAARRLVGLGVLSALPAVLSGLTDWSDTDGAEQRIGATHATLNSVALALYSASWWVRRRPGRAGTVLALAGMAVATGAGYLGGHLAYVQGVGVDTNAFHSGPGDWETVAAWEDLPDKHGMTVGAGRANLFVVRLDGDISAIENRCSHRGGPLADGDVEGGCVRCPWHGSRFDLATGAVVNGPATVNQPVYETRIHQGQIQVRRPEERALRVNSVGAD